MKQNALSAFLLGGTLLWVQAPFAASALPHHLDDTASFAQASAASEEAQCSASIASAVNRIEEGRSVRVATLDAQFLSETYSDFPPDRASGIFIGMEGRDTANILNSPQLMASISDQIITACQPISLVKFAMHQTDWNIVFGIVNGRIVGFECIEPGLGVITRWGKTICL